MKFLISLTVMLIISQFSLADDAIKVFDIEENNMLFPIFNMIAEQMYNYQKVTIANSGATYSKLLRDNSNFFDTHDSQIYEDYKKAIEKALKSVELFEKDEHNCELFRTVEKDLGAVVQAKPVYDGVLSDIITKIVAKENNSKTREIFQEMNENVVKLIKNFVENLDEDESQKKNYTELYELAEKVLQASNEKLKFMAIRDFLNAAKIQVNTTSPNETNCKYDEINFMKYMISISRQILKLKF